MISKYDLYDITYALILIRNDIYQGTNTLVLSQIIKALNDKYNDYENQIRIAILTVEGLNPVQWAFVYHNNVYVNHPLLKRAEIYDLLINLLQSVTYYLEKKEFEQAYDLVDSIHCLPEIIADNNFSVPKSFWETYTKVYRSKWDKNFLKNEQKNYRRFL